MKESQRVFWLVLAIVFAVGLILRERSAPATATSTLGNPLASFQRILQGVFPSVQKTAASKGTGQPEDAGTLSASKSNTSTTTTNAADQEYATYHGLGLYSLIGGVGAFDDIGADLADVG